MTILIILFFLGLFSLQFLQTLPSIFLASLIIIALFFISVFLPHRFKKYLLAVCVFGCGFIWMLWSVTTAKAIETQNKFLTPEFEGKNLNLVGNISSLPEINALGENFEFAVTSVAEHKQNMKIELNWYGEHPKLMVGDQWQLQVRLKLPHGNLNPGGFDYEKILFEKKIHATGYVIAKGDNKLLSYGGNYYFIKRLRQHMRDTMLEVVANNAMCGILISLVLGDESAIDSSQWQVLRDTGTSYLVAIAGLHIGLVAAAIYFLVNIIWRIFPRLILIIPSSRIGIICGLVAATYYSVISGMSTPTQRALIMLIIYSIALLIHRKICVWKILLLTLFVIITLFPFSILDVGFWLSFSAAAFIIYVNSARLSTRLSWWKKYCKMQITATIGLAPLTLLFFQQVSLTSFIANIIALPLVCSVVVPLCLFGSLLLLFSIIAGKLILSFAAKIMSLVWLWLEWLEKFAVLNWHHAVASWLIFLTAMVGVILLLAPRAINLRLLGIIYFLPLCLDKHSIPYPGEVWITLLDVGQGLAVVIQTAKHVLIYDTGPKFMSSDAGSAIVVPFLRSQGIDKVDVMVVSHGDDDHSGGVNSILNAININDIFASNPEKIQFPHMAAKFCTAGQNWQWDEVSFSMLYPEKKLLSNDGSCVLKIANRNTSILLTGDIEKDAEATLIKNNIALLPSTILVAPHHGSVTSSTQDFIIATHPQYVIFSTGYLNHFHFPAVSVVNRYLSIGSKIYNTADTGALTIILHSGDAKNVTSIYEFRKTNSHFWNSTVTENSSG